MKLHPDNEMLLDLIGDDYETVTGRPARIVAIKNHPDYPVVAVWADCDGVELSFALNEKLQHWGSSGPFLKRKPIRETRSYWVNLYSNRRTSYLFSTRGIADEAANPNRTACINVKIDFEHGEGL